MPTTDLDRLETVTYNDATIETYSYDDHGNRIGATDRNAASQTWEYDNRHRLTQVIDAAGNQIDYQYDDAGNKTQQTTTPFGEAALVTSYGYDVLNRLEDRHRRQWPGHHLRLRRQRQPRERHLPERQSDHLRLRRQQSLDAPDHRRPAAAVLLADYQYTLDPSGHRLQIDRAGPADHLYL